ncbi:MAG: MFS transporter, partial [Kovacikia sp.]
AYLDDTVVHVALPKIQSSLGASVSGLQWILNAYTLSAASLMLVSGILGDRYGRKRIFLAGLIVFTIASAVCGFASNLEILIVGRTLQGIGAAALIPGSLAILTDTFPAPKEKAKAIGIWSALAGLALLAGPAIGGLLVDTLGWQSVFFVNIPMGAIAFTMTSRVVKEELLPIKQRLNVAKLLLQPLHLFKDSTFAVVNIVRGLVFFALVSLLFLFSLFLQQVQGYSAVETGLRLLPMNGAFIVGLFLSGWFAARVGWRLTVATGLLGAGVVMLSFIRVHADTAYGSFVWNIVVSSFGSGLALAPLAAAAMNSAPAPQAGIAAAVINITDRVGGFLGIALQGTVLSQRLASDLARSLSTWNIPSNLQAQLVADALHGGTKVPKVLPAGIPTLAFQQAYSNAFVSGMHVAVFVASLALLAGFLLILMVGHQQRRGDRPSIIP